METKARIQWLISFFLITTATVGYMFITLFKNAGIPIAILAIIGSLSFYLIYVKRNTAWLMWILIARGISITLTTMQISYLLATKKLAAFFQPIIMTTGFSANLITFLWISSLAMSIYYWYCCLQLRKEYKQFVQNN